MRNEQRMTEKFGERFSMMRPTLVSRMVEDRTGQYAISGFGTDVVGATPSHSMFIQRFWVSC